MAPSSVRAFAVGLFCLSVGFPSFAAFQPEEEWVPRAPRFEPGAAESVAPKSVAVPLPRPDQAGGTASGSVDEKSVANGLTISGAWSAVWANGSVTMRVDRINNDSFSRTTGSLRLELWAVSTRPARGQGFTGYRLATPASFSQLAPRTFYSDFVRTGTFTPPPNGTYWLVFVLAEFDPVNCSQADSYCIADSAPSSDTEIFGSPPPSVGSHTDLWWSASEPGWGASITHHPSGVLFIAWFTYDADGFPWWYVASECRIFNNSCSATLYDTSGPPFGAVYNPALVSIHTAGTISLTFTGSSNATMIYNVRGVTGVKFISRQSF